MLSKTIQLCLQKNPLLAHYAQKGLINITSLAKYIQQTYLGNSKETTAAIGMMLRRYLSRTAPAHRASFKLTIPLSFTAQSNINEYIFTHTQMSREYVQRLFQRINQTPSFSCVIEGVKEIVLMTNHSPEFMNKNFESQELLLATHNLGFISIDLPITLKAVVGVYSHITSLLAVADIPIHAFHTIGGEVLILVKNEDLLKTQAVLQAGLSDNSMV